MAQLKGTEHISHALPPRTLLLIFFTASIPFLIPHTALVASMVHGCVQERVPRVSHELVARLISLSERVLPHRIWGFRLQMQFDIEHDDFEA